MPLRWPCLVVISVLVLAALGCGDGRPPVYAVKGKVMFDGKPMRGGGSISFVPLDDRPGKTAGGEIAEDGTYTLTTHRPGDGSMAGEFRVVINQVTEQEPVRTADGTKPRKAVAAVPLEDRIPAIYSDAYKSPLRATVEAKDLNEINFPLKRE